MRTSQALKIQFILTLIGLIGYSWYVDHSESQPPRERAPEYNLCVDHPHLCSTESRAVKQLQKWCDRTLWSWNDYDERWKTCEDVGLCQTNDFSGTDYCYSIGPESRSTLSTKFHQRKK